MLLRGNCVCAVSDGEEVVMVIVVNKSMGRLEE